MNFRVIVKLIKESIYACAYNYKILLYSLKLHVLDFKFSLASKIHWINYNFIKVKFDYKHFVNMVIIDFMALNF